MLLVRGLCVAGVPRLVDEVVFDSVQDGTDCGVSTTATVCTPLQFVTVVVEM